MTYQPDIFASSFLYAAQNDLLATLAGRMKKDAEWLSAQLKSDEGEAHIEVGDLANNTVVVSLGVRRQGEENWQMRDLFTVSAVKDSAGMIYQLWKGRPGKGEQKPFHELFVNEELGAMPDIVINTLMHEIGTEMQKVTPKAMAFNAVEELVVGR